MTNFPFSKKCRKKYFIIYFLKSAKYFGLRKSCFGILIDENGFCRSDGFVQEICFSAVDGLSKGRVLVQVIAMWQSLGQSDGCVSFENEWPLWQSEREGYPFGLENGRFELFKRLKEAQENNTFVKKPLKITLKK